MSVQHKPTPKGPRPPRPPGQNKNEKTIYLKSLHPYNFRHGEENPKVIGFVNFTPSNLAARPCFKVEYESDGEIDYIAYTSFESGEWEIKE